MELTDTLNSFEFITLNFVIGKQRTAIDGTKVVTKETFALQVPKEFLAKDDLALSDEENDCFVTVPVLTSIDVCIDGINEHMNPIPWFEVLNTNI